MTAECLGLRWLEQDRSDCAVLGKKTWQLGPNQQTWSGFQRGVLDHRLILGTRRTPPPPDFCHPPPPSINTREGGWSELSRNCNRNQTNAPVDGRLGKGGGEWGDEQIEDNINVTAYTQKDELDRIMETRVEWVAVAGVGDARWYIEEGGGGRGQPPQ